MHHLEVPLSNFITAHKLSTFCGNAVAHTVDGEATSAVSSFLASGGGSNTASTGSDVLTASPSKHFTFAGDSTGDFEDFFNGDCEDFDGE